VRKLSLQTSRNLYGVIDHDRISLGKQVFDGSKSKGLGIEGEMQQCFPEGVVSKKNDIRYRRPARSLELDP
jgi:hypothetical protein